MSEPSDSALEARFRASMPGTPDGACPSAGALWSAARGELPAADLEALSVHLRSCAVCAQALAVSAELAAEMAPPAIAFLPRRSRIGIATAGITALAAGLLVMLWQRGASPPERTAAPVVVASRGEPADRAAIRAVSGEEQPGSNLRLAWTPVDRAVRYRVQVSSEDLQPLYDRTVEQGTALVVPPAVVEHAGRPGILHWQVEALLPDGRAVTSPTFTVRVAPAAGRAR